VTLIHSIAKPEILYSVKAQRGPTLRFKGWKQETVLRMLENNMENAELPGRNVGLTGKPA
jgi:urocanate hydratase